MLGQYSAEVQHATSGGPEMSFLGDAWDKAKDAAGAVVDDVKKDVQKVEATVQTVKQDVHSSGR